jgi:uncharacterized membrane protein
MMQKTRTPVDIHAQGNVPEGAVGLVPDVTPESLATVWVSRFTFLAGGLCLLMALSIWLWRPNHYRLVLVLLTVAMFAAILHSYTMENGHG